MSKHSTDGHACAEYNELSRRDFIARSTAAAMVATSPAWLPQVAYAQTDRTQGYRGIACFAIEADRPGFQRDKPFELRPMAVRIPSSDTSTP